MSYRVFKYKCNMSQSVLNINKICHIECYKYKYNMSQSVININTICHSVINKYISGALNLREESSEAHK